MAFKKFGWYNQAGAQNEEFKMPLGGITKTTLTFLRGRKEASDSWDTLTF